MDTYALINANNIVMNFIVWDGVSDWTLDEGLTAVKLDYADIGGTYDPVKNIVVPPCPGADFTYDESSNAWVPPMPSGDPVKVTP